MKINQLETITKMFEGKQIRSIWDKEKDDYYFSVVDVISALTDAHYQKSRNYWKWLKTKLLEEGSELVSNTNRLKMKAKDGKYRETDTLDTEGIFRLIESIPSKKAEPFKLWLARLGKEEIDSVFDPSKGMDKMIDYYLKKGYALEWIESRIKAIIDRKKLTLTWQDAGIETTTQYATLTNEIYKTWSGMTASEYKDYKKLKKESLRDNMTDIEIVLTDLGEIATREIALKEKPTGMDESIKIAKRGGNIAKNAKTALEQELNSSIISNSNNLNLNYLKPKQ